jgi:type II secretory pathway component PulF
MGSILTVVLAVAVGFFAMAVYLPMWNMTEIQMDQ